MGDEIIDVPVQEAPAQPAQPNPQEQLQILINNELRFAEETIVRALRGAVVNIVNALQQGR